MESTDTTRNSKDVAWYVPDIDRKVTPQVRKMLEEYSNLEPSQVVQHVREIRDRAWNISNYPCTGLGLFLMPMLPKCPIYPSIIKRLQNGDSMLDIGCFIGHDLRRLIFDGAPSNHLYGVDVLNHWELGYAMFRDRTKFSAHFIQSDILHPTAELQRLNGAIDIISITHVLHQWNWNDQVRVVRRLCELSRTGSVVVGYQVGSTSAYQKPPQLYNQDSPPFLHDPQSFQRMWSQAGEETNTSWRSTAQLKTFEEIEWDPNDTTYLGADARIIEFVVTRD